jgi:hypothetical protein
MNVKEIAKQTIDRLPQDSNIDDIMHALYIKAKFENGINEIKQGMGIPHQEAKQRMQKWVK